MPSRISKIWKSFRARFKSSSFQNDFGGDSYNGSQRYGWRVPGTQINWDSEVGDLWNVPGAACCFNWIARNVLQAPLVLQERDAKGNWQTVDNNDVANLLAFPNSDYDGTTLLMGILLSWYFAGDAYIGVERNGYGLPTALVYIPHLMIKPKRNKETKQLYYEYQNGAKKIEMDGHNLIRLRYGIDIRNTLYGLSPLSSAARDGYVMQQDSTYRAKSMMNLGLISGIISPTARDADTLAQIQQVFKPEEVIGKLRDKMTGDNAGEPLVLDIPVGFEKIGMTPNDLLMETMSDRSESLVAACFGVPAQAVGLHVGRLSRTYANYESSLQSAWEEGILPTLVQIAYQLGNQLLPMVLQDASRFRLWFDVSKVRQLQPDFDELHKRERDNWLANLITREQFKLATNQIPTTEDVGVYYSDTLPSKSASDAKVGERVN